MIHTEKNRGGGASFFSPDFIIVNLQPSRGGIVTEQHSNQVHSVGQEGACACGQLRFRVHGSPMFVHCCHCTWCQRESGSAFALNAMIETERVERLQGDIETVDTPSASGKGQKVVRCPQCHVAVWSHFAGAGEKLAFVRVGTLEDPSGMPPDIHIFTSTRQPWVSLTGDIPVVPEYYSAKEYWPEASQQRFQAMKKA